MNTSPNLCIRCGKPRIVTKTWREGDITYSTSACPDPDCQKIVDANLKKRSDHLKKIQELSLKRRKESIKIRKSPYKKSG